MQHPSEEPAIKGITKGILALCCAYGAAHITYLTTNAPEFSAFVGLAVLIGLAVWSSPTSPRKE